ncbi:hypothetical protein BBF96_03055 [Anoxybacter fermentans]|uniref:Major facilitator superfamily (MFS) profile domain-containing protein n=1 Tax=Anoxybacter fermentans TaxID=1323375 RepID=A0A3Q9HPB6_9FIRM|nr:MFS transporter [Anoxybacter fermentans]AZR72451.1 hypothetical protein BBF96_03055 [Anoxybacter fermentans]
MKNVKWLVILKNKNLTNYILSKFISELGNGLHGTAIMLFIYSLSKSGIVVSKVLIAYSLPFIILSPFTGIVVDRFKRKKILIVSDLLRVPLVALIPYCTSMYQILILTFLISCISSFYRPAESALLPNIVSKDELLNANSLLTLARSIPNFIIGASLGGIILSTFGSLAVFLFDAFTYLVSAFFILRIKVNETHTREVQHNNILQINLLLQNFKEGLKYIGDNYSLKTIISLMTFIAFLNSGLNTVLVIFSERIIKSSVSYGFFIASNGIGGILGAFLVKNFKIKNSLHIMVPAFAMGGVIDVLFSINRNIVIGMVLYVLSGFINTAMSIVFITFIQNYTKDQLRGRIFSVINALYSFFPIIAMGLAGYIAEVSNVLFIYYFAGFSKIFIYIYFNKSKKRRIKIME